MSIQEQVSGFAGAPPRMHLPVLAAMPLQRFCVNTENLFTPGRADFTHALFAHITHLELLDEVQRSLGVIEPILGWPRLTHLAFGISQCPNRKAGRKCSDMLALIWSPRLPDEIRDNMGCRHRTPTTGRRAPGVGGPLPTPTMRAFMGFFEVP
ncbi:hypothetical protein B0H13DRAFT_1854267 [Mycena leptocephala]|nr:hypothetical protein B0H13DRAFT_1854267 [Mycena leptocephala]